MKYTMPVVSGGFDPIHSGHIALIKEASKKYNNKVIVLLNSDAWLTRKKGQPFMSFEERKRILEALSDVDTVIQFNDDDNTCIDGLEKIKVILDFVGEDNHIVFCNGGDRTVENIPEMNVTGIEFDFGVGGFDKKNSSSWILRNAKSIYKEDRSWGRFFDLYQTTGCKIKELVIKPGKSISYQKHEFRSEVWFIRSGVGWVKYGNTPDEFLIRVLNKEDVHLVNRGQWHKLWNESTEDLNVIEIQYGSYIGEDDIIRIDG